MKLGLVLEGGASRGYFSVGAMDALMEENIFADVCVGSSAGIANGVSYVSRQKGRSLKIGTDYLKDKRYMGLKHLISPKNRSYYNIPFVFSDLPNIHLPFDYDTYKKYEDGVFAAVTNMETGKCEYKKVSGDDINWTTLVASCALPILFPPIELGGKLYMDGGITEPIPLSKAIDEGCDKIIVVITREKSYVKKKEGALDLAKLLYRKHPEFSRALVNRTDAYNESHKKVIELEKAGKILVIAPESDTSGWRRTESDPEKIMEMYNEGYNYVKKNICAIKEYLEK